MPKKDTSKSEQDRATVSRRLDPERRTVMSDWQSPVSLNGHSELQRRTCRDRRADLDRRQVIEEAAPLVAPTRALVFPGQGSQVVGMGRELGDTFPVARAVFEEVDEALGQNLYRLMVDGPADELQLTENAQPALMAVSLAVVRVLESEGSLKCGELCHLVAGHSLGEYSALTAAGSLSVEDAARVLKTRGKAMQEAVPLGEGAMAALIGLDIEVAQEIATDVSRDGLVCAAANDNGPGQVVVSGSRMAVDQAIELAVARGARRSVLLPVSAPFHCKLMAPAAEIMAEVLESVSIRPPVVPLVSNVSASAVTDPATISQLLVEQVTHRVRWRECVEYMKAQGVHTLVEVGWGKVLSGLIRRIDRALSTRAIGTPKNIESLLESLETQKNVDA